MESYIRTVRNGYDHVLQALPKLLTIWFAMASLPDLTAPNSSGNIKNHLGKVLSHISGRILQAQKEIPASTWYLALPQLVSRISHPHQDTSKQICDIVIKVLTNFPRQVCFCYMMWILFRTVSYPRFREYGICHP